MASSGGGDRVNLVEEAEDVAIEVVVPANNAVAGAASAAAASAEQTRPEGPPPIYQEDGVEQPKPLQVQKRQ